MTLSLALIGCGGMGMSVARALGKKHPLLIVDIDEKRLAQAVDGLVLEVTHAPDDSTGR